MTEYRCVLLGCGHRGETHARAMTDSDRMDLVAVCDRNPEKAEAFASRFDVPATYTSLADALEREQPDHVSAVTGPGSRASVVETVLDHEPASLLIEKPVANTLEAVEAIADLVADASTTVTVCHQKPYGDEFQAVRRWLDEGRFGEIERIVGSTKGGLTGQGTHFLHALDWFAGETPTAVRGFAEGPVPLDPAQNPWVGDHAEPEDTVLELVYPDDVRGYVHLGPDAPDVPAQADTFWYEFRIDLIGTEGRAELVLGDHATGIFADGTERVQARDFDADAYMTRGLYDDVAALLAGEIDAHLADFESALSVHRAIDAGMRSALDGRAVSPETHPIDVGRSTPDRLRRHLFARRQVCASSVVFGDRPREDVLRALADVGIGRVDLWSVPDVASHVDPATDRAADVRAELDAANLSVPRVTVGHRTLDAEDVDRRIRFAAELDADSVVIGGEPGRASIPNRDALDSWLDTAAEHDLGLSLVPGLSAPASPEYAAEFVAELDRPAVGVAVAPPTLIHAGESPDAALARFGDRIDAVYLWDTEPGQPRTAAGDWWDRPDSQVPGGGSGVDFDRLLRTALEQAPRAEWVLRYHGTDDWSTDRIRGSVSRALRVVESSRPE